MHAMYGAEPVDEAPAWATLQRRLFTEIADAADPIRDTYTADDGSMLWPPADDYVGMDAVDDAYESFFNWPLCYVLGGDRALFDAAYEQWETITAQFAGIPTGTGRPQIVREYQQGHDWFHQSEGNLLFYHLCMAAPDDDRLRDLATRFAGFYLNEHPSVPDIYDVDQALVRCPMNGSSGPAYHNFSREIPPAMYGAHSESRIPWAYEEWKERYGLPYYDLEGIDDVADLRDEDAARWMGEILRDRVAHSDTPQNLPITTLLANAYLLTGADEYREWIATYVGAWIERAERNGGRLPDNVDHADVIGGTFDEPGRWFGGWYGWTWPHGLRSIAPAVTGAAELATLVTGDRSHLSLARGVFDWLETEAIEEDGQSKLPHRYGHAGPYPRSHGQTADPGWFDYRPAPVESLSHLWHAGGTDADRDRFERLVPEPDPDAELERWLKHFGGNERAWLAYLQGDRPDYPTAVLEKDLAHVAERRALLETDDVDPADYDDYYFARRNPVTTEALVQLTTGAPQVVFNGGLTVATVRHFDPDRRRPGLPPDVAALVSELQSDLATLTLVNLAPERRALIVQAGGYGEHRFTRIERPDRPTTSLDTDQLRIVLAGRSSLTCTLGLDRYVEDPTYAFPWHPGRNQEPR